MKSVRIFYRKEGRMKFVSHLDMNRLLTRVIRKSGIPVWYTEGFNQHIYINYAVPLSLGFEGAYEVMDIKLCDDDFDDCLLIDRLNSVTTPGLEFVRAAEPVLPTKDIAYAEFQLLFDEISDGLRDALTGFFKSESVICQKKDKKGRMKDFDIMPKIRKTSISGNRLVMILAAGNEGNLNPNMVMNAFFENCSIPPVFYSVKRLMLFDKSGKEFI